MTTAGTSINAARRASRSRRLPLLAVVAMLATAACTGEPRPAPSDSTPRDVTVAFGRNVKIPSAEEGKDYRVVRTLPTTVRGRPAALSEVTDDMALAVQHSDTSSPDQLVATDLAGRWTTLLATADRDGMTSIPEVTRSDAFIVWLQTGASTDSRMSWDLYSYELATRTKRRIASSSELGIKDPPWPSTEGVRPQIVGDHVYWAAVTSVEGRTAKTAILEAPLDGAESMTKVIDDANDVYADGDDLWFQRDGAMHAWDISAGREKKARVAPVEKPCGGYFHEGTLVQVDCAGFVVITEKSGRRTTVPDVDDVGHLNATSRWVGFSNGDQAYVYDLRRHRLMRLKDSQGSSAKDFDGNRMFYETGNADADGTQDPPPIQYIALLPE